MHTNGLRGSLRVLRRKTRRILYWPIDTFDLVVGRRDPLTPPKGLWPPYVIRGGFHEHGAAFASLLVDLGGLKPDGAVLDVGCGIGRVAVPLTRYLNAQGRYEGLDVDPESIAWCESAISRRYPNFRFHLIDVANKGYRPEGKMHAASYRFPFDSSSFDLVFLKSVFTHMLVDEVPNYLTEVARVTKPGGRCLITFFLINEESHRLLAEGKARRSFPFDYGVYRIENQDRPTNAVAYNEAFVRDLYHQSGLRIEESVHLGSWRGREDAHFAQDIIVAFKE